MGNYADCLVLIGGRPTAMQGLDFPAELRKEAGDADFAVVSVGLVAPSLSAYDFTTKYRAPIDWVADLSAAHLDLRFSILWCDDIFDACGQAWLRHGQVEHQVSIGYGTLNFGPGQVARGWVADAVAWVAQDSGLSQWPWEDVGRIEHAFVPYSREPLPERMASPSA